MLCQFLQFFAYSERKEIGKTDLIMKSMRIHDNAV